MVAFPQKLLGQILLLGEVHQFIFIFEHFKNVQIIKNDKVSGLPEYHHAALLESYLCIACVSLLES